MNSPVKALRILDTLYLGNIVLSEAVVGTLEFVWIFLLLTTIVVSLRNKPEDVLGFHTFSMVIFGLFMYTMLGIMVYLLFFNSTAIKYEFKIATLAVLVTPLAGAIFHFEVLAVLLTGLQYFFGTLHVMYVSPIYAFNQSFLFTVLPTYINIFVVFSLCNTHDVSWGTKGIEAEVTTVSFHVILFSANFKNSLYI
jgi:chitin synthase